MRRIYDFNAHELNALSFNALSFMGAALALLMTVLLPRPSRAAADDRIGWGLHHIDLERTTVVVRSTWSVRSSGLVREHPVALAAPLPDTADIEGAEPVWSDDGRIVALRPTTRGDVHLETRVAWSDVRRAEALPVPIPAGESIHRVILDPAIRFRPDPALGLIAQVGHYAPAAFDVVARHRFDTRTDGGLGHVGAYYLRGHDLTSVGALRGDVALQRQHMGRAAIVAGGLFGLVVLGMFIAHRRLGRRVAHERAEAFLEREFRILDDDRIKRSEPAHPA